MSNSYYEYRDLLASSWDFVRGDPSAFPDRQFYRDQIENSGEPALDIGCGTGRLLLDLGGHDSLTRKLYRPFMVQSSV